MLILNKFRQTEVCTVEVSTDKYLLPAKARETTG